MLNKLLRLPASDVWLLCESAVLLLVIRAGLSMISFNTILSKTSRHLSSDATPAPRGLEKVVWSVECIAARLPIVRNCLTKALVAKWLLDRRGYCTQLRIGVKKAEQGQLEAHAWIERGPAIIIGGPRSVTQSYQLLAGSAQVYL